MAKTFWDKGKAVYRDSKGKEIPYPSVRSAVEAVADDAEVKIRTLTQSFIDGKIDLPTWSTRGEELIRNSLLSSGQIAAGGREQMTPALNGRLGSRVKFHLQKWRELGLARERGEVSDAALLSRSSMYPNGAVNVYETIRQGVMKDAGFTEALNVLGAAEHCAECPEITAQSWMPIASMKPPGARLCLSRDRCSVVYR